METKLSSYQHRRLHFPVVRSGLCSWVFRNRDVTAVNSAQMLSNCLTSLRRKEETQRQLTHLVEAAWTPLWRRITRSTLYREVQPSLCLTPENWGLICCFSMVWNTLTSATLCIARVSSSQERIPKRQVYGVANVWSCTPSWEVPALPHSALWNA
jgi:hypothetical protein